MLPVKVSVRLRYTVVQDLILAFIRCTTIKNLGSKTWTSSLLISFSLFSIGYGGIKEWLEIKKKIIY